MTRTAIARVLATLVAAAVAIAFTAHAQEPLAPVEAAEREAVGAAASEPLEPSYLFPEVATRMAAEGRARAGAGAYVMTDAREFARALTGDLQGVSKDKHVRVFPTNDQRARARLEP